MSQLILEGLAIYICLIIFIYVFFLRKDTTAVVDTCWSLGHWVVGTWILLQNPQPTLFNILIYVALTLWAFRLSGYIYFTRVYNIKHKEARYDELMKKEHLTFEQQFLKQIILQVTLMFIFMMPFYISLFKPIVINSSWLLFCGIVFFLGWFGEAWTDWQRHQYRKQHTGIIQTGWWRLSRHPNYFFELVMWYSFASVLIFEPYGFLAFISPIMLTFFMLTITIPVTEEYSLKKNPKIYKKYQQTTSKLIPLYKRRD